MVAWAMITLSLSWGCAAFRTPLLPATSSRIDGGNNNYCPSAKSFRFICRGSVGRAPIPSLLRLSSSPSDNNDDGNKDGSGEIERLRQTASKLRAEAQAAEKVLQDSNSSRGTIAAAAAEAMAYAKPVECFDLNNSCWEITYVYLIVLLVLQNFIASIFFVSS